MSAKCSPRCPDITELTDLSLSIKPNDGKAKAFFMRLGQASESLATSTYSPQILEQKRDSSVLFNFFDAFSNESLTRYTAGLVYVQTNITKEEHIFLCITILSLRTFSRSLQKNNRFLALTSFVTYNVSHLYCACLQQFRWIHWGLWYCSKIFTLKNVEIDMI